MSYPDVDYYQFTTPLIVEIDGKDVEVDVTFEVGTSGPGKNAPTKIKLDESSYDIVDCYVIEVKTKDGKELDFSKFDLNDKGREIVENNLREELENAAEAIAERSHNL